ncbi:MAG: ATP-binding protein [Candidatus Poribacteria bacterium]|nr:ATP-binding protein [Candidatus Poribacteria bacterium]
MNEQHSKYQMNISNTVLYHLGINLYSNVPAVLSEVVANSWDADATNVYVEIEKDKITITDNGHGMTLKDINEKYLLVGYPRRMHNEAVTDRYKRKVMGRKGIGKLSLFSIAETVKVETLKDSVKNGFLMSKQEIDDHIEQKNEQPYEPKPLSESEIELTEDGTRIVLTDLKKRITKAHPNYLRKRIARRFSIIAEADFNVFVNGSPVEIADRDYFDKIQYLWYYGDESEKYVKLCNNLENPEHIEKKDGVIEIRDEDNIENLTDSVKGWIGTVRKPNELTDTNVAGKKDVNENLNKIVIMVRGKLAQENILDDFRQSGFYTKYLIGEIHADFLDMDHLDDIATTSRQEIIKDSPRYEELKVWMKNELFHIRDKWDEWRSEIVTREVNEIPAIREWLNELKSEERKQAESLFNKIGKVHFDNDENRKQLYIHTALAFENLLYKGALEQLERISVENIPAFMEILSNFDDFEASLYYQIIQERLRIISMLHEKVEDNAVEKTIQEILYEHLWLLNPSWDRATETPYMEQTVKKEFGELDAKLTDEQKSGRYDIKYKMTAGKHVIIELKRADRTLNQYELLDQVEKYGEALRKLIRATGKNEPVEIICLVGKPLAQWLEDDERRERSKRTMAEQNVRVVLYDELIEDAYRTYNSFLETRHEHGRVYRLIKNLEIEVPEVD